MTDCLSISDEVLPLDHLVGRGAPDAPALVVRDRCLSHRELSAHVATLAGWLRERGLKPGARVATWLPKTVEAALMPLAAARAGLIHVPINPLLKPMQVGHILADSGADLLLTQAARAETLNIGQRATATMVAVEEAVEAMQTAPPLSPSLAHVDDLAALLYTSGSTGRPKGVMLSHRNLWLGAASVHCYLGLNAADRTLAVLPLSFDYGQNQLLATLHAGGCTILLDYLTPRDVARAVGRHGVTVLAAVPPLWMQLVEADWSGGQGDSLRILTNSGGRLPVPSVRVLRQCFPKAALHLMYGLTEAFRSTSLDPALVDHYPDSIGTAIPAAEVLVLRSDGSLADDNEPGELVHCGPLVAQGYWRDAERTAERFRTAPVMARHQGRAVWSGDSVVRSADGLLRFVGRRDEMIKTSGNRVSPTEIEEAALSTGLVRECAVFGVADDARGEAIILVACAKGEPDSIRLSKELKAIVPSFMQPRDILWQAELPRNPNGKIDRAALKAELGL